MNYSMLKNIENIIIMYKFVNNFSNIDFESVEVNPEYNIDFDFLRNKKFKITPEYKSYEFRLNFIVENELYDNQLYIFHNSTSSWLMIADSYESEGLGSIEDDYNFVFKFKFKNGILIFTDDSVNSKNPMWSKNWKYPNKYCFFSQYIDYVFNSYKYIRRDEFKDISIYEFLSNSDIFPGLNNSLRSEIFYDLDINPFSPVSEIKDIDLLDLLSCVPLMISEMVSYMMSYDNKVDDKFYKCFKNKKCNKINDSRNKIFYYNKKWEKFKTINN